MCHDYTMTPIIVLYWFTGIIVGYDYGLLPSLENMYGASGAMKVSSQ